MASVQMMSLLYQVRYCSRIMNDTLSLEYWADIQTLSNYITSPQKTPSFFTISYAAVRLRGCILLINTVHFLCFNPIFCFTNLFLYHLWMILSECNPVTWYTRMTVQLQYICTYLPHSSLEPSLNHYTKLFHSLMVRVTPLLFFPFIPKCILHFLQHNVSRKKKKKKVPTSSQKIFGLRILPT